MTIIPQEHIHKMCTNKRRFKKEKYAEECLRKIRKSGKIVPPNAVAYHCELCGGWHLGHKKG